MTEAIIYLCGSIKKGVDDTRSQFWSSEEKHQISSSMDSVAVTFLDPSIRSHDISDSRSMFGRDLLHVSVADLVWVDGRSKKGLGVGCEMAVAKLLGVPLVSWCPQNTHYVKENFEYLGQYIGDWIHPFVSELSDYVCEDLQDGVDWIKRNVSHKDIAERKSLKAGSPSMHQAAMHYIDTQLEHDVEMQELIGQCDELGARISALKLL